MAPLSDDKPRVLIPGQLGLTRAREQDMVNFAIARLTHYRQQMGYDSEKSYQQESWLWKRYIATRMYENDFSWRVRQGNLFAKVNMSLNMTEQFITHHHARMTDDLIPDHEFFGVEPEGPEDRDPAIDAVQRLAHTRAKRQKMEEKIKNGLLGVLIRGEAVFKAVQVNRRELIPVQARIALQDGLPLRTSLGDFITERDEWIPHPEDESRLVLQKDPSRIRHREGQLQFSTATKTFHETRLKRGAELTWMHYADFVAPLTVACLDDAELTGHVFEKSVFDLLDTLPEQLMHPAAKLAYLRQRREAMPEKSQGAEATTNKEWAGEQEEASFDPDHRAYKTGRYAELCLRYSPHRNGRYERLYMLIDLDLDWPIHYNYAHSLLTWTERPHPYGVLRIFPSEERWYGQGYYQRFYDNTLFADRCWNRIELELQKSGNLLFENPQATEEGNAGLPIRFRSTETRKLRGDYTADDALTVKAVQPQVQELNSMLDAILQRLQASVGMTSANDPALQNMPAADTLGGMEMLQETSNVQLRKREDEVNPGLNDAIQAWAEADLKNLTPEEIAFLGEEGALMALEWLKAHADTLSDHISIKTETIRKAKLLQENTQVLTIMGQWIQTPAAYKEAMREEYSNRLRLLGVKDPERLLINPEMNLMEEGASPAEAAAAVAGMPAPPEELSDIPPQQAAA